MAASQVGDVHAPENGAGGISIRYAAQLLDRPLEQVETLARRSNVVPLFGPRGRGGALRMERDEAAMLDIAAALDDLRVPRSHLAEIIGELRATPGLHDDRIAIVVRPYARHAFARADADLCGVIGEGAIVAFVNVAEIRDRLAARCAVLAEPLARGRARRN